MPWRHTLKDMAEVIASPKPAMPEPLNEKDWAVHVFLLWWAIQSQVAKRINATLRRYCRTSVHPMLELR